MSGGGMKEAVAESGGGVFLSVATLEALSPASSKDLLKVFLASGNMEGAVAVAAIWQLDAALEAVGEVEASKPDFAGWPAGFVRGFARRCVQAEMDEERDSKRGALANGLVRSMDAKNPDVILGISDAVGLDYLTKLMVDKIAMEGAGFALGAHGCLGLGGAFAALPEKFQMACMEKDWAGPRFLSSALSDSTRETAPGLAGLSKLPSAEPLRRAVEFLRGRGVDLKKALGTELAFENYSDFSNSSLLEALQSKAWDCVDVIADATGVSVVDHLRGALDSSAAHQMFGVDFEDEVEDDEQVVSMKAMAERCDLRQELRTPVTRAKRAAL